MMFSDDDNSFISQSKMCIYGNMCVNDATHTWFPAIPSKCAKNIKQRYKFCSHRILEAFAVCVCGCVFFSLESLLVFGSTAHRWYYFYTCGYENGGGDGDDGANVPGERYTHRH